MKKRIFVTGGNGFIASYVFDRLKELGYQPVTNVRSEHVPANPNLEGVEVYNGIDIRDSAGMLGIIQHVDGVIHLAGILGTTENMNSMHELAQVNIDGGINIISACEKHGVPLTLIGVGNHWMNNPYSITKTTVERFGRMTYENAQKQGRDNVRINVVRAMNAIGPRQKGFAIKKIMPTFINAALRDEPLKVYGGKDKCGIMDLVYAGDVAKALVDVTEKAMHGEMNGQTVEVGSGTAPTVWEIAHKIKEMVGSDSEIQAIPMRLGEDERSRVVADNPYPIPGGYRDVDETIMDTIEYYRDLQREEAVDQEQSAELNKA